MTERLNGEDGLGAIYPAMANSVMLFDALGYAPDHPDAAIAWASVRKLLVVTEDEAYCQPCLSPIWDTGLAGHAIAEAKRRRRACRDAPAAGWSGKQVTDVRGDWADLRPHAPPGGWAFQYANPHYPDVDDTAVVGMLLHRNGDPAHTAAIERARRLDPRHAERERRLGRVRRRQHAPLPQPHPLRRSWRAARPADLGRDRPLRRRSSPSSATPPTSPRWPAPSSYLRREQEQDGSWFGRWGTNYIYGTWSVLCALNAAGLPHDDPAIRRAVAWLEAKQREDGGWGEDEESYADAPHGEYDRSTASQTAWAMLGLMAAGERGPAVARGAEYLARTQGADGEWDERAYTAVGFPRVFYLRYHGYRLFFPLMALARFRNLQRGNSFRVAFGF